MKTTIITALTLFICCAAAQAADVTEGFEGYETGTRFEMTGQQGGTATVAENPVGGG